MVSPRTNIKKIYDTILMDLKPEQFTFKGHVTEYVINQTKCEPVVGCILGWMPHYFKNTGIRYRILKGEMYVLTTSLRALHITWLLGLRNSDLAAYLFYGVKSIPGAPKLTHDSTLEQVRAAWKYIIDNYDTLDPKYTEELTGRYFRHNLQ